MAVSNKKLLISHNTYFDMNKRAKDYLNSSKQKTSHLIKVFTVKNGKDYVF